MTTNPLILVGILAIGIAGFMIYRKRRKRSKLDQFKDTMDEATGELNKKVQEIRTQTRSA